ncbi:MAG: 3-deoxy-D-manno-octulosonic acid kinase [Steroidobacteraceae bacterium]
MPLLRRRIHAAPLKLLRTATRSPAGLGAAFVNAAAEAEVHSPWFEPRHWHALGAVVGTHAGRGTTLAFEHAARGYVLRHYCRGGLMSRINHDSYLWLGEAHTRPLAELKLTMLLHDAGLPVPRPVAARYERSGPLYRADIITEYLPQTATLAERLDAGELGLPTWAAIGRCIRRFHDYGLCHADLNAHNILLRGDEEVFLIDFDRASRRSKAGLWRDANLARLRRSLDALEDGRAERRFDDTQWQCLLASWL